MLSMYPACFFKEYNGYSVIFPDLNVATCGDTVEESMSMAIDCLAGRLYWLKKDGEPIPEPSPMDSIDLNAIAKEHEIETEESFVNIVSVDVAAYARENFNKTVKKTLSIPQWLNDDAKEHGINFSQTLQEALKQKLSRI